MFCSNCGKELFEGARFCPECGTPVPVITDSLEPMADEASEENAGIVTLSEEQMTADTCLTDVTSEEKSDAQSEEVTEDPAEELSADLYIWQTEAPEEEKGIEEPNPENCCDDTSVQENDLDQENAEIVSLLENMIPAVVSYGNVTLSEAVLPEESDEVISDTDEEKVSDTSDASEDPVPVRIPDAYKVSADQPVYVQEYAEVTPPAYAQPESAGTVPGKNPPEAGKKKKSKLPFIIAAVLILACVIGYFVYQNLPSVKFDKAMTAGEEAYGNGDYITALEEFHKAYEIDPDDEVTHADLFACYDQMASDFYDGNDYASCIEQYEEAKVFCPEYIDQCDTYIKAVYSDWCLNTASDGELDKAEQIYAKAAGAGYDMTDTRNDLDVIIATAKLMEEGRNAAQYLAENIDKNNLSLTMLAFTNNAKSFVEEYFEAGGESPIVFDVSGCEYDKLGFYDYGDGMYAFYFGEYDGDLRHGSGSWFIYVQQGLGSISEYEMDGTWINDLPEGEATEHFMNLRSMGDTSEWYIYSTVVDGLYDGTVIWDYPGEDQYTGTFHNGIVEVIDTVDPNGNNSYVVAYNTDKNGWIYYNESQLNDPRGIRGIS